MNDLHAAISLYTHGVISRDELREIASVYYKVSLGKTNTTPYINTPYIYQPGHTWPGNPPVISTTTTTGPTTFYTPAQQATQFNDTSAQAATTLGVNIEDRPTKCACKHD